VKAIYSALWITVLEIGAVALVAAVLDATAKAVLSELVERQHALAAWANTFRRRTRNVLITAAVLLAAGAVAFNTWLAVRGIDVAAHTGSVIWAIDSATWIAFGLALVKLLLGTAGVVIATRLIGQLLRRAEAAINRWDRVSSNNQSLRAFFGGVERVIANCAWMMLAVMTCRWFGLPTSVSNALFLVLRIYLVIVLGLLLVRSTTVIVDTLEGWARRSAEHRGWTRYYHHVRPLVPTFRACVEYALWIVVASLVVVQIDSIGHFALWGPRLIQSIGVFFVGRLLVEIGILEIGNRMLPPEGLEPSDRRRRETILPLVRSVFTYAVYFGSAVLILSLLGFNPIPFLAGAGILGVVIGFGAQSMINDLVCGFFILFENTYLVGDMIEIGSAKGTVEGIDFRTTKIRDGDGRLHVIRNGETKQVINYSKDYTRAVVTLDVAYDIDLRSVFKALSLAGERLRAEDPDVLDNVELGGISAFGTEAMTVRASARVKPGRHEAVAAHFRLLINDVFDRQASGAPRPTLIPEPRATALRARR